MKKSCKYCILIDIIFLRSKSFYGCTNLTSITIPDSLLNIDDSTFTSCANLRSVIIPSSVTSVGTSAFRGCAKLAIITTQSSTPPAASESSFDGVDKTTAELNVPKGSEQVYAAAKGWSGFRNIRGYEPTGVKAQTSNIFSVGEKYYSPSGAETGRLSRGLNIVKQTNNDGTVKTCKVLIK